MNRAPAGQNTAQSTVRPRLAAPRPPASRSAPFIQLRGRRPIHGLICAALCSLCAIGCGVLLDIDHVPSDADAQPGPEAVEGAATGTYVTTEPSPDSFTLSVDARSVPLVASSEDHAGVIRVLGHLQADLARVTGAEPELILDDFNAADEIVLVGTLGQSPLVDQIVAEGGLDVEDLEGRWEKFVTQVVERPLPGVDRALVIAGSDKRGTIYGVYDLSNQIGVSPWYWWADVPVAEHEELYVLPGRHSRGEPAVKYRGIFINDEAPALSGWVAYQFGRFSHEFYEKVFELMLRLRANYLWPAMWGKAFNTDDPVNPELADEYGLVMGTSHHEPMMRAQVEWERAEAGPWDYNENAEALQDFWRESIVTVGMRGHGDTPMSEQIEIELLERIVADQRDIIAEVTGEDPSATPQVWALYKEVQDYYDQGMRVADDISLLFTDDRWGNIRRLPEPGAPARSGGYGVYYHYDFVGDPRSYKWLNTSPIPRVWEQLHMAYRHSVDRIWIVNVGDIKPMEFPTQFFLDYAWDPESWPAESLPDYTRQWAARQFGEAHAASIAHLLTKYTQYNGRRKPELLDPNTYSLIHHREAERVVAEYNRLVHEAEEVEAALPERFRNAFFQLVRYPVEACANLNELYVTVAKNRLYAEQGRSATNELAERAHELFARDAELSRYYNETMADGKWNHMMDQTHIGYTGWQQPDENVMPTVEEFEVPEPAEMGVAIEGSESWWPGAETEAVLPEFSP